LHGHILNLYHHPKIEIFEFFGIHRDASASNWTIKNCIVLSTLTTYQSGKLQGRPQDIIVPVSNGPNKEIQDSKEH